MMVAGLSLAVAGAGAAENARDAEAMAAQQTLTLERLYGEPDLSGAQPRRVQFSPDGAAVTYLKGSEEDPNRYELWRYDRDSGRSQRILTAEQLGGADGALSEEEQARRERQRIAALTGIVDYQPGPLGRRLLVPLAGALHLHDLESRATQTLAPSGDAVIDPKFSPDGGWVAYVRNGDLYAIELAGREEKRLTTRPGDEVSNGLAEFIAQEEMDRDTGYWWSPDSRRIAFLQVDESAVRVEQRFEVQATSVDVVQQRYPATGTANVTYRLGVVDLETSEVTWLPLGESTDIYIPRVDWFPDGTALAVQRQSRDQQRLELLRFPVDGKDPVVLLAETGDTWVDIYDDLTFIDDGARFIWSSSRDGYKHLYLYRADGRMLRQLTAGPWEVTGERNERALLHVDGEGGWIYFMATRATPTERHLYRAALDAQRTSDPERLSGRPGWHTIRFAPDGESYVDVFSNVETPPSVTLHEPSGERIGDVEANALDDEHPYAPYRASHAATEFGTLEAEDGQTLHYSIKTPKTRAGRRPVVIMVYGGPHGPRIKNQWGNLLDQVLVDRGYIVFSLDNRGTDFRGVDFDRPIYRNMGDAEVRDQAVGVAYLRTRPDVDPDRIGMFGWSYGGYMTLMCLTRTPDLYAAGVAGAPVTDWRLYDTHYTERYMSTPADNEDGYRRSNVLSHIEGLRAPLLLMHGMADDNVLFSHSTALMKALQDEGKLFELMTYPGAKHGLLRDPKEGLHAYRVILDFFDRRLAGPARS